MSRIARLLFTVIAIVGVLALFTTFHIRDSFGQTRPALVRDVDEPGRVPYQSAIFLSPNDSRCSGGAATAFSCDVTFPGVPSGKRLVIQHASASQVVNSAFEAVATIRADASGLRIEIPATGHVPLAGGKINLVFTQTVHGYVEAGDTLRMVIGTAGAGIDNSSFGRIYFISGYLVDVLP